MAKLSDEETRQLKALEEKRDAPEPASSSSQRVDIYVDLGDDNAVARAIKLGILKPSDVEEDGDGDGTGGGDGEEEEDEKPRRRRTLGERWAE